jgi:aconitate hydratase
MSKTRLTSQACKPSPRDDIKDAKGAMLSPSWRQHHDRPHFSGRFDQERQPCRKIPVGHAVTPQDFNSYGARRGNHEVMMRGTFANIRIKNEMLPGTEGGLTNTFPSGEHARSMTPR